MLKMDQFSLASHLSILGLFREYASFMYVRGGLQVIYSKRRQSSICPTINEPQKSTLPWIVWGNDRYQISKDIFDHRDQVW